jgi:hypothetical protein
MMMPWRLLSCHGWVMVRRRRRVTISLRGCLRIFRILIRVIITTRRISPMGVVSVASLISDRIRIRVISPMIICWGRIRGRKLISTIWRIFREITPTTATGTATATSPRSTRRGVRMLILLILLILIAHRIQSEEKERRRGERGGARGRTASTTEYIFVSEPLKEKKAHLEEASD